MSGWIPAPSVATSGYDTATSDTCCNWKPKRTNTNALGHAIIFPKCTATRFMEELPEKDVQSIKGSY